LGIALLTALTWNFAALLPAQKAPSAKELVAQAEADESKGLWDVALQKLKQAAAQKPKDTRIAEMVVAAQTYLADKTATDAMGLCDKGDIPKCESEIARAKAIKETPRIKEAQERLAASKKSLQDRWDRVQQLMKDGQLDAAGSELNSLDRFAQLLPNLAAEKEHLHVLRIQAALEQGRTETRAGNWDAAVQAFLGAQRLDPGNSEASRGIEEAKQEKEAVLDFQQAQNAFQSNRYDVAWEADQKAIKLFPSRKPYQDLAKQIGTNWSAVLIEDARKKSANTENLKDNQEALDMLETIRHVNPQQAGLAEELRTVRLTLNSLYIQKAGQYELVTDGSRTAITFIHYLNAQQTNQGTEFPFAAKLRETKNAFDRKRSEQLLLNVENLSSAAASNGELLLRRVRSVLGKLGLPDLRLRTLDEYSKNAEEDPQFKDNRPDGKSPTVQLTVELANFEAESSGDDKPVEKPSKFVSGQETVANPAYADALKKFNDARVVVDTFKKGKPVPEGTRAEMDLAEQLLKNTPQNISRDKISDYTYQQYELTRRAVIRMNLELRDMLEKQLISDDKIEVVDKRTGVEIAGVRDKDVNQLINKPARLPSADAVLQDAQRVALTQLDEKLNQLVAPYVQRFYAEGEKALRDNRVEDAVENFLCHWYFFRGRLPEEQSKTIRTLVKRECGLDLLPGTAPQ